jgi:hypothetical protein
MKEKISQARLSFSSKEKIKVFQDKQKWTEFVTPDQPYKRCLRKSYIQM